MAVEFTLAGFIREQAELTPDGPCLSFGDRELTFSELDERSSRLATALVAAGVGPGDRVAILAKNDLAFYELAFACSKARAMMMALNWRLAARELAAILEDGRPALVLVGGELQDLADAAVDPSLQQVALGEDYEAFLSAGDAQPPAGSPAADDVVLLLYTSGTTGLPKGVMLTNRNMSYTQRIGGERWEFDADSVNLVAMPLFHVGGIGYGLNALFQGGQTVVLPDASPEGIIAAIEGHRVTNGFFVPAVIQAITGVSGVEQRDLSSLQLVVYGASPISESVLERAIEVLGCRFTHAYGLTETAGTVISLHPDDHDPVGSKAHLLRSCGVPFPWIEMRLVEPVTEREVSRGEVGEIRVRSEQITPGYWEKPEETARTITPDGWLCTGDAAYQDAEGYVYLHDRYKDMIVSGGENVYPAEVENVLYGHPAVSEVAVVAAPHERWGETVKAVVVVSAGVEPSEETGRDIIAACREQLAHYKCPTSVDFVAALPRSASGKVMKKDLRTQYWTER
jgi:acyl-CoA synthetase (AMP-forming)/AMP-acid ligase II